MSRIDIAVSHRDTNELIANRGFCRGPHLTVFCGDSVDETLQDFADDLYIGLDLNSENIDSFLDRLIYIRSYLLSEKGMAEKEGAFYDTATNRQEFIAELDDAIAYFNELKQQDNFEDLAIAIG